MGLQEKGGVGIVNTDGPWLWPGGHVGKGRKKEKGRERDKQLCCLPFCLDGGREVVVVVVVKGR